MTKNTRSISIFDMSGAFAENKDVARSIRLNEIIPALEKKEDVVLDFEKVEVVTQGFIHVLISNVLRKFGPGEAHRIRTLPNRFRSIRGSSEK